MFFADRAPGYDMLVALIEDEVGGAAADELRAPLVLGELGDIRQLHAPHGDDLRADEIAGTAQVEH